MAPTALVDLPPELLDQIATYLPTARTIANLGRTNKALHTYVENEAHAWKNFNLSRFPSPAPVQTASHKDAARTLTTLSKAWDRRAFVARYIEPHGHIRVFPGDRSVDRWKRPRGQTIGFTPKLDCYETIGSSWRERNEVLAFSAGAEICLRQKRTNKHSGEDVRWMVFRPLDASEGKDDITSLHLLRTSEAGAEGRELQELITGTASGDLQLLNLPGENGDEISKAYFVTQGQSVRSSSLLQRPWKPTLLAANLGDDCVSLYEVDTNKSKIDPTSSIRIPRPTNSHRAYRTWSTNFLSQENLAVGLGPSEEPLHIYSLRPSGIDKEALRKYSLQNDSDRRDDKIAPGGVVKRDTSSVYPVVPLPPFSSTAAGSSEGKTFLSGGHDGLIRLHDLRSHKEVERMYIDPTDDSPIYSLLPRGQERLVAGTGRHTLLKVFDMRLGARAYSYLDNTYPTITTSTSIEGKEQRQETMNHWNLFLKPQSATYPGRGGGNNWARRSAESSIYSLASPSPCSPFLYAGVENAIIELAFTSILDPYPDPVSFDVRPQSKGRAGDMVQGFRPKEVLDLAMYDQTVDMMKLKTQRSLWETFRVRNEGGNISSNEERLDERWKVVSA